MCHRKSVCVAITILVVAAVFVLSSFAWAEEYGTPTVAPESGSAEIQSVHVQEAHVDQLTIHELRLTRGPGGIWAPESTESEPAPRAVDQNARDRAEKARRLASLAQSTGKKAQSTADSALSIARRADRKGDSALSVVANVSEAVITVATAVETNAGSIGKTAEATKKNRLTIWERLVPRLDRHAASIRKALTLGGLGLALAIAAWILCIAIASATGRRMTQIAEHTVADLGRLDRGLREVRAAVGLPEQLEEGEEAAEEAAPPERREEAAAPGEGEAGEGAPAQGSRVPPPEDV